MCAFALVAISRLSNIPLQRTDNGVAFGSIKPVYNISFCLKSSVEPHSSHLSMEFVK